MIPQKLVGSVGSVEKVFFVCLILTTEHLIVLLNDIVEREFVRVNVDHYRYHVTEGVWVKINFRKTPTVVPPVRKLVSHWPQMSGGLTSEINGNQDIYVERETVRFSEDPFSLTYYIYYKGPPNRREQSWK
jgi:hypothetical protein